MRTDCRICHGTNLELILPLTATPIGDEFLLTPRAQPLHPIDLYQCKDCGLAQLLYEIAPEQIYRDYLYLTSSSHGLDEHFDAYASHAIDVCGLASGDLVVDIGSNDGTLLKHFQRRHMRVLGIEASPHIAARAEEQDIPTMCRYFGKDMGIGAKAKLITANNVVANMNDLDAFMEAVLELLAHDGTLVFESFYLGDVVKNMVFDFIYHEHLSAFSVRPIKHLMRRYGMKLYRTEHLTTKGGSIRYYCTRYYAKAGATEVEDDEAWLYEPQTYEDFAGLIEIQRRKTLDCLTEIKRTGRRIVGFGASISCTTLLYHFGLAPFLEYLVDDNPEKIGRYSPGHHLLVREPAALYRKQTRPEVVLALAWRFVNLFRSKHPSFSVVTPLPRFQCDRYL